MSTYYDEMGLGHHGSIHNILYELGHVSDERQFAQRCNELGISDIGNFIEKNQAFLNYDDISSILTINKFVRLIIGTDAQSTINRINACFKDAFSPTQLLTKIQSVFPNSFKEEQFYIQYLLQPINSQNLEIVLAIIEDIPERVRSYEFVAQLIKLIERDVPVQFVSNYLNLFHPNQRIEALEVLLSIVEETPDKRLDESGQEVILMSIKKENFDQRLPLIEKIGLIQIFADPKWMSCLSNFSIKERTDIVDLIYSFPKEERRDILNKANLLIGGKEYNFWQIQMFLGNLLLVKREERTEFVQKMLALQEEQDLALPYIVIIQELFKSREMEAMDVAHRFFASFSTHKSAPISGLIEFRFGRALDAINAILQVPAYDRKEVTEHAFSLLQSFQNDEAFLCDIIHYFIEIPPEKRNELKSQVIDLSTKTDLGILECLEILTYMNSIPVAERMPLTDLLVPIVKRTITKLDSQSIIKEMHSLLSFEERETFLQFLMNNPEQPVLELIRVYKTFPLQGRTAAFKELISFFQKNKFDFDTKMLIIIYVMNISLDKRTDSINKIGGLIKETNPDTLKQTLGILHFLPFEEFDKVIKFLVSEPLQEVQLFLNLLLKKDSSLIGPIHKHFLNMLKQEFYIAMGIVGFFQTHSELLMIPEEGPLNDLIVELSAKPSDRLFLRLKREAKPLKVTFELPQETIAAKVVSINVDTFQKRNQVKSITAKDLPKVDSNTLTKCFEDLETRLSMLDKVDRDQTLASIQKSTGETLENLRINFLSDSYIQSLFVLPENEDGVVSDEKARFFAILSFIHDQPNNPLQNQRLTVRERVFLAMSTSIQNCPYGKSEGIYLAYNLLPASYRLLGDESNEKAPEIEKAKKFVDGIVQISLNNALSGENALMKAMTETPNENGVAQLAHQSLYLKNFLGPTIGLRHKLKYDEYSGVIKRELIQRTLEGNAKIFYDHYKPNDLIKELMGNLNANVEDSYILFPGMSRIQLFNAFNSILEKTGITLSEAWEMNNDSTSFLLTEKGAREILIQFGYLTPHVSRPLSPGQGATAASF